MQGDLHVSWTTEFQHGVVGFVGGKQQSEGAAWAANRDTTGPMLAAASHTKCLAPEPL